MNDPNSHLSMFAEVMMLRNEDITGYLSPNNGTFFYAEIIDNVLVFSSYR